MRVPLFIGCVNDVLFPRAGVAAARILHRLGVDVDFPAGQTCCGQAHWNSGYRAEACGLARHFLDVFEGAEYVVAPTGSCVSMMREYYPEIFRDQPALAERVRRLVTRTYEFSQFLTDVLGVIDLGARYPARAVHHASCHMTRLLGASSAPLRLLAHVEGLELRPFPGPEQCCGFGGTFAVKSPELSMAMADEKLDAFVSAGAELVISADTSCLLHLMGRAHRRGLPLRFLHVAEVLAEGTGLLEPDRGVALMADTARQPLGRGGTAG
ncbi:MAG: (Fe-S)-binding protein [Bacillota bacterium]